jgi:hypothetical protein
MALPGRPLPALPASPVVVIGMEMGMEMVLVFITVMK